MPVYESDVCIVGAGISAAMLAQKLSELRPGLSITIVEAGRSIFDFENRFKYRERMRRYDENPWPGDFIEGHAKRMTYVIRTCEPVQGAERRSLRLAYSDSFG